MIENIQNPPITMKPIKNTENQRRNPNLSLGLDAYIKRVDSGGEDSGKALAGEGIEEKETRRSQHLEPTPFLDNPYVGLLNTCTKQTIRIPHNFPSSLLLSESCSDHPWLL